jgi:O-antigen ligase
VDSTAGPSKKEAKVGFHFYALHIWTVFGLSISNLFLGLTLIALPRAPHGWTRAFNCATRQLWLPLILYTLFLAVSILLSVEPATSRPEIKELFSLSTLPLAFAWVSGRDRVRRIMDGLVLFSTGTALWGLAQFLFGYGELGHRIRGPFSHYMTFSGVLLMADLILISQLVCRPATRTVWRWAALLLINVALVGTLTRSAWVALLVAVVVLALIHKPKAILAIVPAVALAVFLAPATIQQRFVSIFDVRDVTNYDRLCMVEAGLRMVRERPLFGLGPEAVGIRYPIYRQPTAPRRSVPHLHNSFVHLAAERGLTSLAAYLWLMGAALVLAYRSYRRQFAHGQVDADLYLASFLTLLAFNVAGVFEANWRDTELQRLALFLVAVPYLLRSGSGVGSTAAVRQ